MDKTMIFALRVLIAGVVSLGIGITLAVGTALMSPYLPFDVAAHNAWPMVLVIWAIMLWINGRILDYSARWMPA